MSHTSCINNKGNLGYYREHATTRWQACQSRSGRNSCSLHGKTALPWCPAPQASCRSHPRIRSDARRSSAKRTRCRKRTSPGFHRKTGNRGLLGLQWRYPFCSTDVPRSDDLLRRSSTWQSGEVPMRSTFRPRLRAAVCSSSPNGRYNHGDNPHVACMRRGYCRSRLSDRTDDRYRRRCRLSEHSSIDRQPDARWSAPRARQSPGQMGHRSPGQTVPPLLVRRGHRSTDQTALLLSVLSARHAGRGAHFKAVGRRNAIASRTRYWNLKEASSG